MTGEKVVHRLGIQRAPGEHEKVKVAARGIVTTGRAAKYVRRQNTSRLCSGVLREDTLYLREKVGDPLPLRAEERKNPIAHKPMLVIEAVEMLGRSRLGQYDRQFRELPQYVLCH